MSSKARIATVCQAGHSFGSVERNRDYVMSLLDLALSSKPDLVCLPETFTTGSVSGTVEELAEPLPGPTTDLVSKKAKEHRCYIVCPLITRRDGRCWNSAVLLDRQGQIAGVYDKIHPVTTSADYTAMESGLIPGPVQPPVVDLDFGCIGIQICYDAGFPETWQALASQGARLIFWPSAYNGGFPLQVYAYLHHVYVVSSVHTDKSRIIDPLGKILVETDAMLNVIYRDINLDYLVCHWDFNYSIPDQIVTQYGDRVEIRSDRDSAHFLVEPRDNAITIAQLQAEFGFESTFQYHQRHREAYLSLRQGQVPPPQTAAHGSRPEYAKW